MTQEIIEMAKQAEFDLDETQNMLYTVRGNYAQLEAFVKLVAEKEREANAKMVDHILKEGGGTWGDAIRARGQA